MGMLTGLIGFVGLIICFIGIFVNLFKKLSLRRPIVLTIAFFAIFVSGIYIDPLNEEKATDEINSIEQGIETINEINSEENDINLNPDESDSFNDYQKPDVEIATPEGALEVHFIDVGQGDSIYIKTPEQNILIDGGGRGSTVLSYLSSQGVNSLDLVIGTHPQADHIGGLINVIKDIPVLEVIDPAVVHTTQTFEDYLTIIDATDIKFTEGRAGMVRDLGGGAILEILHPVSPSSSNLNNASIVVRVNYGNLSFMLTGDIGQEAERQVLSRGYDLKSTILKVGHHGSSTSTTQAFLNAVNPEVAVIMCGKNNSYGHPHEETLLKLYTANIDIYRTDLHGTIVVTTDGQTYSINNEPFSYSEHQQPPPSSNEPEIPMPLNGEGKFVGSKNSDKYHYPNCNHASTIAENNRIWFNSVEDALVAGYVACKGCNPPGVIAEPKPEQSSPPAPAGSFVGSRNSDKYHYPSCSHAKSIKPENLRWFNSVAEAKASGYVPCKSCKPPQ